MELVLAVIFYCSEAGLEGREEEMLLRIVPSEQHNRLAMLLEASESEFGGQMTDLDEELKRLTESGD